LSTASAHTRLSQELARLRTVLNDAEVVETDSKPRGRTPRRVNLGSVVKINDLATGKTQTVTIGSYLCGEPGAISYASPLGSALLNRYVGETCTISVGGEESRWKIVEVD